MRFVVDTNVLFSFFWKNSPTKNIMSKHKLVAPILSLKEINKYESLIKSKTNLSKKDFSILKEQLAMNVDFVDEKEYCNLFKQAEKISNSFSGDDKEEFLNDLDFFALALKLNLPIWSNDKLLKKQSSIQVFNTIEVLELL